MRTAISATRNTCFAILSAIEVDLRDAIALACLEDKRESFLPADVRQRALGRFSLDNGTDLVLASVLDYDLLAYTDFGDLAKLLAATKDSLQRFNGISIDSVAPRLEKLSRARNRVCHSRPLEESDLPDFLDLAKDFLQHESRWGWDALRGVQDDLEKDPSYVLRLQIPEFWRHDKGTVPNNLPLPDYDETSFLGRLAERKDLKKHLLGRHPVVTLVGEGGVGKTALALQCVYDLLELGEECPYEAIVWTSLKNKVLTAAGISSVQGAVVDVLGILQESSAQLGASVAGADIPSATQELLSYIKEIRVLLIIDNFETLTTNPLRDFFAEIPEGSKVLITSRVGLGELELRYALDTLDIKTASNLLRKYALALNLPLLGNAPQPKLDRYANFVFRSPLLIKWFVQSIAAGADPERTTSKTNPNFAAAIKFCFENLFSRLSDAEREVLHILAAVRKQLTFTELMFIIQMTSNSSMLLIEAALSTLHSSSMIKRTAPDVRSSDVSTRLNLTDIALEYLGKFAPPGAAMMAKVQAALKKLREVTELGSSQTAIYKYDITAVRANSKDERICAVYLNQALSQTRAHDYDGAKASLDKVFTILPSYSEAYRIASFAAAAEGDLYRAAEELDRALEHDPNSSVTFYQYASFALQKLDDAGLALEKIDLAIKLDPKEETLHTLRALALVRLGRCSEAAEIYDALLVDIDQRPRKWRITTRDQASECFRRWAEQNLKMRDVDLAKAHLLHALQILEGAIAHSDFDDRMGRLYANVIEDGLLLAKANSDDSYARTIIDRYSDASKAVPLPGFKRFSFESLSQAFGSDSLIEGALREASGLKKQDTNLDGLSAAATRDESLRLRGNIKAALMLNYGFIRARGQDWFFHKTDLIDQSDWPLLTARSSVSFEEGRDAKGKVKAVRVQLDE